MAQPQNKSVSVLAGDKDAIQNKQQSGFTGFKRDRLPDPLDYFTGTVSLKFRERRGKWRTTECRFHGGSDSMRINIVSGSFVCMAGCGARGGDIVAYHMAAHGLGFIDAARALGAWTGGDRPPARPTPLTARDALQVLAVECNVAAVAAANVAHGVALTSIDLERLLTAAGRINAIGGLFA